jgi:uncharacterized protein YegP (UPF0339 family)
MIRIYQDAAKQWRWRYVAKNGRITADSGEGYVSRSNAERAARDFKLDVSVAPIV